VKYRYQYVIQETVNERGQQVFNNQGFFDNVEIAFFALKELQKEFPTCSFLIEVCVNE
jgi:hypothetical protein